ncbi:hypothetical protein H6F76_02550 [Leptolyngbya sp. FACHB-321]|uniref:hypothetical protein n=1 Tax=Leptolyngbya sp. FACHB-321 TaxID=2692807 RepID=UPI00168A1A7A|nr:hypothetical protein [Leptolyngbya sp. FACHB-321]MBD2033932.1 hypothetical protein [Leptolyngbya sp. FACHB-321]
MILGAAGSGKTHLIMRLAKEQLCTNRLLFIRQPNNATAVLHRTYLRILESLAEPVVGSDRTQLELLLTNSFVNILSSLEQVIGTQTGQQVLAAFQADSLQLYVLPALRKHNAIGSGGLFLLVHGDSINEHSIG